MYLKGSPSIAWEKDFAFGKRFPNGSKIPKKFRNKKL